MAEADGSVIFKMTLDDKQAQEKLNQLEKKIDDLKNSLNEKKQRRSALAAEAEEYGVRLDEAQAKLHRLLNLKGNNSAIREAREDVAALKTAFNQSAGSVERLDASIAKDEKKMKEMEEEAGRWAARLAGVGKNTTGISAAASEAEKRFEKLSKRISGLAKRALVFALITKALRSVRDYFSNVIKVSPEAVTAIARLKGALLTLAQPILNVVIPAFTALINIISTVISHIGQLVATLFGSTYSAASKSAEELYNEQNALTGVGGAAKKASKSLANFDEINQLTDNSGGGGGGASTIKPDFTLPELSDDMQGIVRFVEDIGLAILAWKFSDAFLSGLAALTGLNIPKNVSIGISLMIAGVTVAAGNIQNIMNGEYGPTSVQSAVRELISGALIGAGLVALGVGAWAIPVAISLVATVTDVVANWEDVKKELKYEWDAAKSLFSGDADGFWENFTQAVYTDLNMDTWANKLWKKLFGEENWENLQKAMEQGLRIDDALKTIWNKKVVPWFKNASQDVSDWFSGVGDDISGWFSDTWGDISDWFTNAWDDISGWFSNIGKDISGWFSDAWNKVKNVWKGVSDWFNQKVVKPIKDFFSPLTEFFDHLFYGLRLIVEAAWVTASTWFDEKVVQPIVDFFEGLYNDVKGYFENLWDRIEEKWKDVSGWFNDHVVQPIVDFFKDVYDKVKEHFEKLWSDVKEVWQTVSDWFKENVTQPVSNAFSDVVDSISGFFTNLWDGIKEIWQTVSDWFKKKVINPIKEAWEEGLQGISDFAKGIFNGIMGFFESLINGIIDGLNKFLGFFNTVAAGAGKLLEKDWTDIGKINHVSLPRLAQGAVIPPNREFMAVLGDQKSGTNIETPLATMVQAFRQALSEGGYGGSSEAVLMLDRETLGKVVWKLNKAEGNRIGVNLAGV